MPIPNLKWRRIPYESVDEFLSLWQDALLQLCNVIWAWIAQCEWEQKHTQGQSRLAWTDYDLLVLGLCDFDKLEVYSILEEACKGCASKWCRKVAERLQGQMAVSSRAYVTALRLLSNNKMRFNCNELGTVLQSELYASMGSLFELLDDMQLGSEIYVMTHKDFTNPLRKLFHANFVRKFYSDGKQSLLCSRWMWQKHLLAVMMGAHERLGAESPLQLLDPNLLSYLCKFL